MLDYCHGLAGLFIGSGRSVASAWTVVPFVCAFNFSKAMFLALTVSVWLKRYYICCKACHSDRCN